MEERKRKRNMYVTPVQKKKLIELLTKHPMLLSGKRTQSFSNIDAQRLWQSIAKECNSIPGAKKHWRQWKKSWQDMRSKYVKRKQDITDDTPISILFNKLEEKIVSNSEKDVNYTESTEFVILNDNQQIFNDENLSEASISAPTSPQEEKVFAIDSQPKTKSDDKNNSKYNNDSEHSNCNINCDLLVSNEKKKIKLKEDFINFKKDYLRQKLKLLKEQTEALKYIAKEICNK